MPGRNTLLTWEAIYDVADIAEYIEAEFGIDRADEFQNDMKEQISLLGSKNIVFGRTQIYYRNHAIHKKRFLRQLFFMSLRSRKFIF